MEGCLTQIATMGISRLNRIKKHRIFRDFSWPGTLPEFARFNLIYGWNGSGKTTLSNLFRAIEKKQAVSEGEIEIIVDGKSCFGATFSSNPALPNVRVFNREYVEASVFRPGDEMEPIFVLGEDSVEKQKEIAKLRRQLEADRTSLSTAQQAKRAAEKSEDTFSTDKGVLIKNLIGGEATSAYRNYDKRGFRTKSDVLMKPEATVPEPLSEEEKQQLVLRQQEKAKERLAASVLSLESVSDLHSDAATLLSTTVVARVIQHFVDNPDIAAWVESGLGFHKVEKATCEFCGQKMPLDRLNELEGHFNDEDQALKASLDALAERVNADIAKLEKIQTPKKAEIYSDMAVDYETAVKSLEAAIKERRNLLEELASSLKAKRAKAFERLTLPPLPPNVPPHAKSDPVVDALGAVNKVITNHNSETDGFETRITTARKTLETRAVADALPDYKKHRKAITDANADCERLTGSINDLEQKISKLDQEISEHLRPAEELNRELCSYLGRDELVLKAEKKGYSITRHGFPARHLSEGEKTAIAFLHFLKSLNSKDFNLKTDIVVIDDPVSSLDSNALFCAFGFMKERTRNAGQLIILTHNFGFFQQVKNWFHHRPDKSNPDKSKRMGRFYMLDPRMTKDGRFCSIQRLDPLLERFQSEYHYLFSRVYEEAHGTATVSSLAEFYGLPNMARRLLESFLAFRQPGIAGELSEKIEAVTFEAAKKARLLRFFHTFSHGDRIAEPEHDLSILSETRDILRDLMDLIKSDDLRHFDAMVELVAPPVPTPLPSPPTA